MRPATVAQRFRSLQQFFKWLAAEGEIRTSPMANMKPPAIPEEPPPVIDPDEMRRLLASCAGTDFEQRRDTADHPALPRHRDAPGRDGRAEARGRRLRQRRRDRPRQGPEAAGLPVRPQDRPGHRPLPAGPGPPSGRGGAVAVDRPARPPHRHRHRAGHQAPRRARQGWSASTPISSATPTPTRCCRPGCRRAT